MNGKTRRREVRRENLARARRPAGEALRRLCRGEPRRAALPTQKRETRQARKGATVAWKRVAGPFAFKARQHERGWDPPPQADGTRHPTGNRRELPLGRKAQGRRSPRRPTVFLSAAAARL